MPKKTQQKISNVRLRRSKPTNPEMQSDEEVIEIDTSKHELDLDSDQEEAPSAPSASAGALIDAKPKAPKKPRPSRAKPKESNIIDFKAERDAFNNFMNEQREQLAKERAQHLETMKAEVKIEKQSLLNTRDARLRLMSSLNL